MKRIFLLQARVTVTTKKYDGDMDEADLKSAVETAVSNLIDGGLDEEISFALEEWDEEGDGEVEVTNIVSKVDLLPAERSNPATVDDDRAKAFFEGAQEAGA